MTDSADRRVRLLSIEDDPVAAELLAAQLGASSLDCVIQRAASMAQAVEALAGSSFEVVLLDLELPDSHGLDGLELLLHEAETPIIVVTSKADESVALEALAKGAQDYLFKGEVSTHAIVRSVRYAIERHRLTESLRELSLIDELTGLYNRRGFSALARQQLKVAARLRSGAALVIADVDDFKRINDEAGHLEGDRALQVVARSLEHTFRAADVIARWGGDEFVILGLAEDLDAMARIARRLERGIQEFEEVSAPLRVSLGLHFEPRPAPAKLDAMLESADRALYAEKSLRKQGSRVS